MALKKHGFQPENNRNKKQQSNCYRVEILFPAHPAVGKIRFLRFVNQYPYALNIGFLIPAYAGIFLLLNKNSRGNRPVFPRQF